MCRPVNKGEGLTENTHEGKLSEIPWLLNISQFFKKVNIFTRIDSSQLLMSKISK
jgi:hypothetical protein